jgi:hypothetical protein
MKRILAVVPCAALFLAGCGGDTCTSNPATLQNGGNPNCTVAAGQQVTFNVALSCKCTDSAPSCQAELRADNTIEVSPVFQQCQASAACSTGCAITQPTATCSLTLPASLTGSVPLTVVGDTILPGSVTIGGGSTVCNL